MQNRSNRGSGKPVWVMVIIMGPYIKGNRDFPFDIDFYKKGDVDLILTSSGHADDQGDAVPHRKPGGRWNISTSLVSP